MRKLTCLFLVFTATAFTACANTTAKTEDRAPQIGMANPASQYCAEQGGKTEIRKDAHGAETGYCHLAEGEVTEEWALFRNSQAKCLHEEAKKLAGQTDLSDEQIKQKTGAAIVRYLVDGQLTSQELRVNRINVILEAESKKISRANCG